MGCTILFARFLGQVRSECLTCTFRASYCSARLSRAQVPAFAVSSVRDRRKKGGREQGGTACTCGYNGLRAVRPESVAGGGWFLWNLECPVGLSQREICAHCSEGHLAQFGGSAEKNKELWSYVVKFEFSSSKSSSLRFFPSIVLSNRPKPNRLRCACIRACFNRNWI